MIRIFSKNQLNSKGGKVRSGHWHPDENEEDRKHKDAMAAKGYWQAFQAVKASVEQDISAFVEFRTKLLKEG
jgi:hypothetical protein